MKELPLASRHTCHDLVTGIAAGHKPELRRAYMTLLRSCVVFLNMKHHAMLSPDGIEMPGRLWTCLARCAARFINNNRNNERRENNKKRSPSLIERNAAMCLFCDATAASLSLQRSSDSFSQNGKLRFTTRGLGI